MPESDDVLLNLRLAGDHLTVVAGGRIAFNFLRLRWFAVTLVPVEANLDDMKMLLEEHCA